MYFRLESKNTASQNIGVWDRMMTSYNSLKNMLLSWIHWPKIPQPNFKKNF